MPRAALMSCALALLALSPDARAGELDAVIAAFAGHDQDGDGHAEIAELRPMCERGEAGPRVLVLVEARLTEELPGAPELAPRIARWVEDLASEGYRATALSVALGRVDRHQDGLYVLALRELLRAVAAEDELAGALLLGHFPDAFLVRTCNWRKRGKVTLRRKQEDQRTYQQVPYLRRVPEDVAHRADIVLCDLDGNWEDVYLQPATRLESVVAIYPDGIPPEGGPCADLQLGGVEFEDVFHLADGRLELTELDGGPQGLALDDHAGNLECGVEDGARPNPLPRPDVLVSRVDARGVALRPRADVVGEDGAHLLDEQGRPRTLRFASKDALPHWREALWEPDPSLERELLAEYLDRNHAYRTGAAEVAWRPASLACDLGSGYRAMSRAADDWVAADPALDDIHGRPRLTAFVDWVRRPALLRTLRAHSDAWGSVLAKGDVAALEGRLGTTPIAWAPRGAQLVPSLSAACGGGKLDWFLLRNLWRSDDTPASPAFYVHTGCHGITPPGARALSYDHPSYGRRQGAESLLFFAGGLALVGRSKVFYDEPRGFAEALGAGEAFGAAWARYFELESQAESWGDVGGDIGRKRATFWSVLGDWTLRLRRPG